MISTIVEILLYYLTWRVHDWPGKIYNSRNSFILLNIVVPRPASLIYNSRNSFILLNEEIHQPDGTNLQ